MADERVTPTRAGVLRHYWRVAAATPWQFVIPLGLVLVAGVLEFWSFSLLIPLTTAVGQNSFDFLAHSARYGWIPRLVPAAALSVMSRDVALVTVTVALIIAGRIAKLAVDYVRGLYIVARTERYRVAVTAATFDRVLAFGRQYFSERPLGHVQSEVDWSDAVIDLLVAAEEVTRYLIGLAVKVIVMLSISVPLSVVFAITLPFVSWVVRTIDTKVERIATDTMRASRHARGQAVDILGSIPLIKVNSQEREAARTYRDALREAMRNLVNRERITRLRWPVEEAVILIVMLAAQATVMMLTDGFTPGHLAAFGAFLLLVQQSLPDYKYVGMFRLRIAEERPKLDELVRLYSDEGKHIVPSGAEPFAGVRRAIEVRDLTFAYRPDLPVLRGITTTIAAGQVTAIVGHSGAGKTTFVDLIARLYDCPPSTIVVDGIDIREFSLSTLHGRLGVVSQDVWLLNRTLRDNLTFGLDRAVTDAELVAALTDVALDDFLATLPDGLDTSIGDRGIRLSGGQRQRVALARALIRNPDVLILDEATSALDSVVEQRVADTLQERFAGRTLIVIAHRLSTIRRAAKILVMEEGRVVEEGRWDDLVARGGTFARLHNAQFRKG